MSIHDLIFYVVILASPVQMDDGSTTQVLASPFETMEHCGAFDRAASPVIGEKIKARYGVDVKEIAGCLPYDDAFKIFEEYHVK